MLPVAANLSLALRYTAISISKGRDNLYPITSIVAISLKDE